MRWWGTALAALVAGAATTGGGYAVAAVDDGPPAATRGPGTTTVTVTIQDSRFAPDRIDVWAGTQVRFVVRNRDPIGHELVVGPDEVHRRHRGGTEAAHPPVPGEVSLGPGQTGATVFEADRPGTYPVVCHLPRHERYGMVGELVVHPRPG